MNDFLMKPKIASRRSKETSNPLEIFIATSKATVLLFLVIILRRVESAMPQALEASGILKLFSFKISCSIVKKAPLFCPLKKSSLLIASEV